MEERVLFPSATIYMLRYSESARVFESKLDLCFRWLSELYLEDKRREAYRGDRHSRCAELWNVGCLVNAELLGSMVCMLVLHMNDVRATLSSLGRSRPAGNHPS